jgi:predicted flap endonuclease-1-like 5' DNA nuclease
MKGGKTKMVKLIKINQSEVKNNKQLITAELFADSKTDDLTNIVGVGSDEELAMGSSVITADGDLAFLKSDSTWNWI